MDQNPLQKPFDLAAFRQPAAQPQGATPEQLAEALGPFSPPEDDDFGDEFEPAMPRPISRENRRGSYASRRRSQPLRKTKASGCVGESRRRVANERVVLAKGDDQICHEP